MAIKVRATQAGHYGHHRDPGETFEVEKEQHVSSRWMVRLDTATTEGKGPKAKAKGSKGKPAIDSESNVESDPSDEESDVAPQSSGDVI